MQTILSALLWKGGKIIKQQEVCKSVLSILTHTRSKDGRKKKQLYDQEINMTYRLKSEKSAKNVSYTKTKKKNKFLVYFYYT